MLIDSLLVLLIPLVTLLSDSKALPADVSSFSYIFTLFPDFFYFTYVMGILALYIYIIPRHLSNGYAYSIYLHYQTTAGKFETLKKRSFNLYICIITRHMKRKPNRDSWFLALYIYTHSRPQIRGLCVILTQIKALIDYLP